MSSSSQWPPLFSIVTPLLNGVEHVPGYVQSLLRQACGDWEAIIVDDGSVDGGRELLAHLTAQDNRFRFFSNGNPKSIRGPYQARNIGLEMANGRYVCFLDIDDRWFPGKLSAQQEIILRTPSVDLLYSAYFRARCGCLCKAKVRTTLPLLSPKILILFANPVPMLTSCVRRSLISQIRFEAAHHEDYIFWREVLGRISLSNVSICQDPLAVYAVSSTSLSGNKLKVIFWIWGCYRTFGYSLAIATLAIVLRGILQCLVVMNDALIRPLDISSNVK